MDNEKELVNTLHEICKLQKQYKQSKRKPNDTAMIKKWRLLKQACDVLESYRERFGNALDVDHQRVVIEPNKRPHVEVPWIRISPDSYSDPLTGWFVDFLFSRYGEVYIVILFGVACFDGDGYRIGKKKDAADNALKDEKVEYLDDFETDLPIIGEGKWAMEYQGAAIRSVELVLNDLDDEQVIEKVCRALQGLALIIRKNIT